MRALLGMAFGLLIAPPALAQASAEAPSATDAAPVVEKPVLVDFVEAAYPPAAREAGLEAVVPLMLTLDAEGAVTDAVVLEPQGNGFDEAALEAMRRSRFRPAMRNGRPVAARIRYAYAFTLPEPAASLHGEGPTKATESAARSEVAAPADVPPPSPSGATDVGGAEQGGTTPPGGGVEIVVRGESTSERLRRSAQAISVIDTSEAKRQSADLGQVMSRAAGVNVRRTAGLGSDTRVSLYGLTDDQIRFFENGIPLEFMGFGSVADVPVNLVERVEVYRGVVPIRFGADALGGAVNVVTDDEMGGPSASASYQVGSYGTYRVTLGARQDLPKDTFVSATAFWDHAENDYPVEVQIPDELGRLHPERVRRFHDAYVAKGATVDVGIQRQPWAKKLVLKLFTTDYRKDLQHNVNMTVPYGEAEFGEAVSGATLRYEKSNVGAPGLSLFALAGYSRRTVEFEDVSEWFYDWRGQRRPRRNVGSRPPGELGGQGASSVLWEDRALGRLGLSYVAALDHVVRFVSAPAVTSRTGKDRLWTSGRRDPLSGRERVTTVVSGLEHEMHLWDNLLENIVFVKDYLFGTSVEQVIETTDMVRSRERAMQNHFGFGDALRVRLTDQLWAKASYEKAARLPRPDEVFGNGTTVLANPDIAPELSDNGNLGLAAEAPETPLGAWRGELNGFVRDADDLILLVPAFDPTYAQYINVGSVTSKGFDVSAGWTSRRDYLSLDGNVTWFNLENTSEHGPYAAFRGERVPNRPWFTANGAARLRFAHVAAPRDELWLSWDVQYVGPYFTGWESAGRRGTKSKLDPQLVNSAAIGYGVQRAVSVTSSFEVQNVTDEKVSDVFGVQKMGRAYFFKGTVEL